MAQPQPLAPPRADDPELDATDYAHPAWWRGHEHTTGVFCQMVNEILDGKDDGHGANREPWGATRRRLLDLVAQTRPKMERFAERSAASMMFCEHANENPARCYCKPECACRQPGAMHETKEIHQRITIDRSLLTAIAKNPESIMEDTIKKFETENPTLQVLFVEATSRAINGDFILRLRCQKRPS